MAEGSGAAVSGAVVGAEAGGVVAPLAVVRAGAAARWTEAVPGAGVPSARAEPAGARRRGACTGRAETSGERRADAGRTGPGGVGRAVDVPARGVPTVSLTDGPEGRTGALAGAAAAR
ncbi:hypothetical protein ACN9M0_36840 [Streptomyces sp. R-07]|uniref:hypothetical protein n=1 Tax=unclassified Streptomyces TaxID=2593676 RepID=UPI0037D22FB8